jgi:hypothetical protein
LLLKTGLALLHYRNAAENRKLIANDEKSQCLRPLIGGMTLNVVGHNRSYFFLKSLYITIYPVRVPVYPGDQSREHLHLRSCVPRSGRLLVYIGGIGDRLIQALPRFVELGRSLRVFPNLAVNRDDPVCKIRCGDKRSDEQERGETSNDLDV